MWRYVTVYPDGHSTTHGGAIEMTWIKRHRSDIRVVLDLPHLFVREWTGGGMSRGVIQIFYSPEIVG